MSKQKKALLNSALSLLLCFSMLLGTTWAWFTDSVTSTNNIIKSGKLDVEMSWSDTKDGTFKDASTGAIFDYEYWEPGFTQIKYVKIDNVGNLAFRYVLNIIPNTMPAAGEVNLADVIDVYLVDTSKGDITRETLAGLTPVGTLSALMADSNGAARGVMLPVEGATNVTLNESDKTIAQTGTATYCIALKMQESAGNEYQDKTVGGGFAVQLLATQYTYENDTFGNDFDTDSEWPGLGLESSATGTATVTVTDGKVDTAATISTNTEITATVPKDVAVDSNTLTLTVSEKETTDSGLTTGTNEELMALDVHIDGVSEGNETAIIIALGKVLPVGMNMGNVALYHVEDGKTNVMTQVETLANLDEHNEFYYDPATGEVTVAMATFSEVAMTMDTENAWNGEYDYSWYTNAVALLDGEATADYTIANADQLAAFGAIVGGMADGIEIDDFYGKTVKLISDINLGDKDNANESLIFHPIGYYYTDDKNKDGTTGDYYSTVSSFGGTFDGNGHTIANFYQNTWEIKGDYDGNYYKDAMGLFGYVVNGKVCNLTVDNFSSDGEFTPTGVIAAYAVNSTFENIAITNCNPRVYNTGNGGIVGIGGNSDDPETYKLTFTNITIDNTNKISALWGSWDVACGGLVGMFRGAGHVSMTNCHVAAQIDVYNDVCGNYQYYWYRYAGMMVGTNKNMVTDSNGYTVPETDKYHAENCTVHFGEWNDYYYCELVANSLASYTHDHQFSRLEQIQNVSEIQDANGNWNKTGNFILMNSKTPTNTCYHIMKDANGNLYEHKHDVADATNPEINEVVNGETVLKENNQRIYLPFNQLFTGYGWGVKHIPVTDYAEDQIKILDREIANSVKKFEGKATELANNTAIKLGNIFSFVDNGVKLVPGALTVTVTNLDENNPVSAKFVRNSETWENGTLTLTGTGKVTITIQDYYFCTPTTIEVNVTERQSAEKFDVVMNNGDFLHRVGNVGTVALSKLFAAKSDVTIGNVSVAIETVDGTAASGAYTANTTDWTKGTIQFSGTGVVKVTIKDDDKYCTPTVLYLEVVDATNVTGLSGTITSNVVLLNECGLSSLTVSGRNTVYGNGFTCTYSGNGQYLNNGLKQGVITVSENGILDNLRIKATIYPAAYMYYGDQVQKGPSSTEGDKVRYHYQLSAIAASGNATISNCYIYGGRTNIFINSGDVTVKDTVLECGTLSNVQIQSNSNHTVTFEDVTTIQHQVNATIGDTTKVMLGAGIVLGPDTNDNPTIVLNGDFKQYNWVTEADQDAVSDDNAKLVISNALGKEEFHHTINGATAVNLGIIYLNEYETPVDNSTGLPYELAGITAMGESGKVYSLKNATAEQIYSDYANADRTTVNGDYLPTFDFDLGEQEISYDGSEDTRYLYGDANGVTALYQDGDAALTLDLSKLATIYKYTGLNYTYTAVCKDSSGNALTAKDSVVTLSTQGNYTLVFTVVDNIFYDKDGKQIDKSVTRTYEVPLELTVKEASIKNAEVNITKTALDGVYTTVNITDYKLRINFLECISVTDYDKSGTGTSVSLSSNISSATLTPSSVNVFTTAFTATITYTDGRVLTVNFSKISGSSAGTKTAAINTGGVYFITDGALNNKPTESSSQNKCTITSVSFKGNSGSTVTNDTDVTVTWALGSSSSGGTCIAEGTMITLADGSKKAVEDLRKGDVVMAFDHVTGEIVYRDVLIVGKTYADSYYKNTFIFDDGTSLVTINEHGIYDLDLNQYINIGHQNYREYVGHRFVSVDSSGDIGVKRLVDVATVCESGYKYDIVTNGTFNYVAEDTLSVTHEVVDIVNSFAFGDDMLYDAEAMKADIEKYGLYTYEDFAEYCDRSVFEQYNMAMMKIGASKGYYTKEHIVYLLTEIALNEDVQIID